MVRSAAIGIICKTPQPGRTKTRLAAEIGAEQAAKLSACFLRDVAAAIEALPNSLSCEGYAVYAPAGSEDELGKLLPPAFAFLLQADAELGKVLYGATCDLLAAGHDCAVLVNGDSPTLPSSLLAEAVAALREPGDRMVLGPASDGGYYLIGLKQPHRHVFTSIPWGTDAVARLTRKRASEMRLDTILLHEWYDVDDGETFGWLRDELAGKPGRFRNGGPAAYTRAYMSRSMAET